MGTTPDLGSDISHSHTRLVESTEELRLAGDFVNRWKRLLQIAYHPDFEDHLKQAEARVHDLMSEFGSIAIIMDTHCTVRMISSKHHRLLPIIPKKTYSNT
ncbi:hypothetical protein NPIL_189351 [Nephila pilipes]|uniref:Uncharacterized protein n=1 Tax=Nephila pilipes TaxID=299642 RepID=A0A8X6MWV0_NEPPI|nr:hypothetical protein NPIL_189351 [Nephila pilipes]